MHGSSTKVSGMIHGSRCERRGPAPRTLVVAALAMILTGAAAATGAARMGPLSVSNDNPRYFAAPDGTVVYLAGAHTWNNLIDMSDERPPRRFDFSAYLRFLGVHHLNFVRLWAWELPDARSERYGRRQHAEPQPWLRTGPGEDVNGLPRFDLTRPNAAYFARLRDRVAAAATHGIYVSVMLFEGWGAQFAPGKSSHPFNRRNNINGVDYGDDPRTIYTLKVPGITAIQEDYLRRVVDAVDGFDNVLYEIVNEAGTYSTAWQAHMIEFVRGYEATKDKQHPIGMTSEYPRGDNAALEASRADWISPNAGPGDAYLIDPAPADGRKVIVVDTDHIGGSSTGTRDWVWRSFTRGMNLLFMDLYTPPDSVSAADYPLEYDVRTALGDTRLVAQLLPLRLLVPRPGLASTGYALAGDHTILVYQPALYPFWVDLAGLDGPVAVEWFDTVTGLVRKGESAPGDAKTALTSPFLHPSVALLRSPSNHGPDLASIEPAAREMREQAIAYLRWPAATKQRFRNWLAGRVPAPGANEIVYAFAVGFVAAAVLAAGALVLMRRAFRAARRERLPRFR